MIYNRQKLLMKAISEMNCRNDDSKTYLVKTMFLLRQSFDYETIGYNFFPHHYGPFSNVIYEDIDSLRKECFLKENKLELTLEGKSFILKEKFNNNVLIKLNEINSNFSSVKQIKSFVYDKYKDTTIKSNDPRIKILSPKNGICSIGYEGETIDSFLNKLILNNVSVLIDVRKNAFSMKSAFRKRNLENYLHKADIAYLHIPELGIDSNKRQDLETDADYKALFKDYEKELPEKKEQTKQILNIAKNKRVALMCFEADHNHCHRGTLSNNIGQEVTHL